MKIEILGPVVIIIQLVLYLITLKICTKEIRTLEKQNLSILEANTMLSSLEKYNMKLLEKITYDFCIDDNIEDEDTKGNDDVDNLKDILSEL